MSLSNQTGTIVAAVDLTPTAREITFHTEKALTLPPGSFINCSMHIDGVPVRRAFSVVDSDSSTNQLTIAVRLSKNGTMTPEFWKDAIVGRTVSILGPLGVHTADQCTHRRLFLFGYGIGAGVIRAIASYAISAPHIEEIVIVTGSRSEDEIVYHDYFLELQKHPKVRRVAFVVSNPKNSEYPLQGYIQDHIHGIDFSESDVYMCGQKAACNALETKIQETHPQNTYFLIESFH